jgi:predicted transcriptional regulator
MDITLEPASERALRELAERSGLTVEQYAAETLSVHAGTYDQWFVEAVKAGLEDAKAGKMLTRKASQLRDEERRARLANRVG